MSCVTFGINLDYVFWILLLAKPSTLRAALSCPSQRHVQVVVCAFTKPKISHSVFSKAKMEERELPCRRTPFCGASSIRSLQPVPAGENRQVMRRQYIARNHGWSSIWWHIALIYYMHTVLSLVCLWEGRPPSQCPSHRLAWLHFRLLSCTPTLMTFQH